MATTFGAWVRRRRRALDLTQAELADRIGYSTVMVRRIESGERRPSRELLDSLAEVLQVPADELDDFRALGRTLVGEAPDPAVPALRPTAASKLQPPPGPSAMVPRTRLLERLDEAWTVPLTTVVAATGFGKTVTVAAWADTRGAAWLTLEPADADLRVLARGVLDATRLAVPALDPARLALHDRLIGPDGDDRVRADAVAARLVHELTQATARPIALVLDGLDVLDPDSAGLTLIEGLVRLTHPQLHLVLVSRNPPGFGVERLRARGSVLDIGPESLRFGLDETRALLRARLGEGSDDLAPGVHRATEGWPAAVRLAGETLVETPEAHRPAAVLRLRNSSADLFGLLAEQVLSTLPEPSRELLRVAAALPEFDLDLCRRLGLDDADAIVDRLAGRGVLRARVGEATWQLSEVVRTCVALTDPLPGPQHRTVLRVGADWLVERGEGGAALDLLRHAGDAQGCAKLLDDHADDLVSRGHAVSVAAVAGLVPAALRSRRAEAAMGQAFVIIGRWEEGLDCMRAVSDDGPVPASVAYWTGLIHHLRGDLRAALQAYDRWTPCPDDDPAGVSLVHSMRASTRWLLGQGDQARTDATTALQLARRSGDPSALAGAHTALAMIATGDGDRRANDVHDRLALEFAQAAGNALQAVRIRSNRGSHLVETAEFELALEELDVAIELAELTGFATFGALARSNRAEALAALARHDEATAEFLAAAEAYDRLGSRLVMFPLRGLADLQLARGELRAARSGYERVLAITADGGTVQSAALARAGLARALAGSEPAAALALAERALAEADGLVAVPSTLAAGWVLLAHGERDRASALAEQAAGEALARRDGAGFAEARELTALSARNPTAILRAADDAVAEWQRIGDRFSTERARFVRAAVAGDHQAAEAAWAGLRDLGVRDQITESAGPVAAAAALTSHALPAGRVRVSLLGPLRVRVGGRDVAEWPDGSTLALVRLLATSPSASRGRLGRSLAAGRMPADADADVEAAIDALRSVLDPHGTFSDAHFVRTGPEGVEFVRENVEIDLDRFMAQAGAALASGTDLDALAEAETYYTGEVLEGEALQGEQFAEQAALREECRAVHLAVLRRLVEGHARAGNTDEALRHGLRLLRVDPYDEPTHLVLVGRLAAARRHGEALRHYRLYTARMRDLGIEPAGFPGPASPPSPS